MRATRSNPGNHASAPWAAGLLAVLALAAPGTAGAQSAGERSLFADGAGNRALSMGGAFAAMSDDASGLLWNPGGLGRLSRTELQAGQTRFASSGSSETHVLAAMPNWRWGSFAAAFRSIGTDGIEQRDDRNFVVGPPVSDGQIELGFGYGRAISEAWSAGGSFKARHQSVGGYSAGGFGLDLGVVAHPLLWLAPDRADARDVSFGFALNNFVRPSLRLDQESVSDPTIVRTGFAWQRIVGGFRTLTLATDIESGGGVSRAHTGAELRLLPQLALRMGFNGTTLTAGTGFTMRDVSVDYAFESRALEPIHRVGLGFAFGHTVMEARAAAERAEEERLQARLEDGFKRRQAEQVTALLERAGERRAAGAYDEAIDLLASVVALDPSRADATALQAACHRDRGRQLEAALDFAAATVAYGRAVAMAPGDTAAAAGHARCEAASDSLAARSTESRKAFARALDAFGADDLPTARRGFRQVLEIEPSDRDAAAMLRRTDDAIARRVQNLLREVSHGLESARVDDVAGLLDEATLLDPEAPGLAAARSALSRARAQQAQPARDSDVARRAAPARTAPTMSAKELDLLYKRGLAAMQAHRSDDALRYWELVWTADPNYAGVADCLKRECLTRGMEAFAAGRLDEAAGFWRRALRVDPRDPRAIAYLQRAQQQLSRTREILGGN